MRAQAEERAPARDRLLDHAVLVAEVIGMGAGQAVPFGARGRRIVKGAKLNQPRARGQFIGGQFGDLGRLHGGRRGRGRGRDAQFLGPRGGAQRQADAGNGGGNDLDHGPRGRDPGDFLVALLGVGQRVQRQGLLDQAVDQGHGFLAADIGRGVGVFRQAGRGKVDLLQVQRRGRQHDPVRGGFRDLALGDAVDGQALVIGDRAAGVFGGHAQRPFQRADHRHAGDVAHRQLPGPKPHPDHKAHRHQRAGPVDDRFHRRRARRCGGHAKVGLVLVIFDICHACPHCPGMGSARRGRGIPGCSGPARDARPGCLLRADPVFRA